MLLSLLTVYTTIITIDVKLLHAGHTVLIVYNAHNGRKEAMMSPRSRTDVRVCAHTAR